MSADRQVLFVDTADGALDLAMEELSELGFRVIWTPTVEAALSFMQARPTVPLIVASSSATKLGGAEFPARARDFAPEVRIICGGNPDATPGAVPSHTRASPDSLVPEPIGGEELRCAISELLAEHFYPSPIAEAVQRAALEVLGDAGFAVEGGAFLVANQTALSELSAVIPFAGGGAGHLMVGLTKESARALHQAILPGVRPVRVERMEDLVGELCNQILGRINSFFTERSVSIQHGTPIFIRAAGSTLRFPARQPSFAVTLARGETRVSLEYYLSHFDRATLQAPIDTRVLKVGEICYL